MIGELTKEIDSIHLQLYRPTEYLLFRQLTALERQYRNLIGENGVS